MEYRLIGSASASKGMTSRGEVDVGIIVSTVNKKNYNVGQILIKILQVLFKFLSWYLYLQGVCTDKSLGTVIFSHCLQYLITFPFAFFNFLRRSGILSKKF